MVRVGGVIGQNQGDYTMYGKERFQKSVSQEGPDEKKMERETDH